MTRKREGERELELSVPHPDLPGGRRSWRLNQLSLTNDLTKQAYAMKPPSKSKRTEFREHLSL